jgi:hypothetical protein
MDGVFTTCNPTYITMKALFFFSRELVVYIGQHITMEGPVVLFF